VQGAREAIGRVGRHWEAGVGMSAGGLGSPGKRAGDWEGRRRWARRKGVGEGAEV
jgi:hypothetical protein